MEGCPAEISCRFQSSPFGPHFQARSARLRQCAIFFCCSGISFQSVFCSYNREIEQMGLVFRCSGSPLNYSPLKFVVEIARSKGLVSSSTPRGDSSNTHRKSSNYREIWEFLKGIELRYEPELERPRGPYLGKSILQILARQFSDQYLSTLPKVFYESNFSNTNNARNEVPRMKVRSRSRFSHKMADTLTGKRGNDSDIDSEEGEIAKT